MNLLEAEAFTGLKAREIKHPDTIIRDRFLSPIGDMFRCQLGRMVPHTAEVVITDEQGNTARHVIKTAVFQVEACGSSFEAAVANLRRASGADPSPAKPAASSKHVFAS